MPNSARPTMGGPEYEELTRQKEREHDAERARLVLEAAASERPDGTESKLDQVKHKLGIGNEHKP